MEPTIRPIESDDLEAIVALSLAAWAPVFRSFEQVLGPAIYGRIYPDWQASQRAVVEEYCADHPDRSAWVAEVGGNIAGFLVLELNMQDKVGEVQLLAVDPRFQRRGIATALNSFALDRMKEHGMRLAVVGTGGDAGHTPARKAYEKAGYVGLPLVRYYKDL